MSDRRSAPPGDDDVSPQRGRNRPVETSDRTTDAQQSPRRRGAGRISVETELEAIDDDWDHADDEPNYLIRRVILIAVIVVGVLVAFVVVNQVIGADDGGSGSDGNAAWDTLLVFSDDQIMLLDRDGLDELDAIETAPGLLDAQAIVAGNTLVTMTDRGLITQISLADGTDRRGRAGLDETLVVSPDNPMIGLVAPDGGGDVTIVDTIRGAVLSIGDTAGLDDPLIFAGNVRVNQAGTHVAAPVPSAFQSVVIDMVNETAQAYAGRVIAIDDTRVVTEQPAGDNSEIEFHDLAGERLGTVDVPSPAATLLTPGGSLLLVGSDGSIRVATDDGEVDVGESILDTGENPVTVSSGFAVLGGERLVVSTSAGSALLDASGAPLALVEGTISTIPSLANRCAVISSGSSSSPSTVLDLDSGAVIAEIDRGLVTTSSLDGCTAAISGGPSPRILTDGELVDVDANSIEAISPDGRAYIVLDGRDTEYVNVDDADPVEITDEPSFVRFGLRE